MPLRTSPIRSIVGAVTIFAFLLTSMPPVIAQDQGRVAVNIEECNNLGDPDVRAQIRALTQNALTKEVDQIDYTALVEKYWREAKAGERLDREIDDAIRIERANTNVFGRAYSTISQAEAEKTATAVAERTFGSEDFKSALNDLAEGVGKEFGGRIERAASGVAGPVIACVRTALQTRYGGAVAQVFARETEQNFNITSQIGAAKIDTKDLFIQNVGTISGIALIVSRRIISRLVASMGRRIAGLIATRLISTFTGLVGLALIARDVYEATEGVFPLIEERMKSDEAKTLIKDELTKSIKTELTQQTAAIADETTDRIYAFWQDFKQKYNVLLSLAEKSPDFAEFLKTRTVEQLGRLGRLVSFLLSTEGETGVLQRTRDGRLRKALADLDDAGVNLAIEIKSIDKAVDWAELAGQKLPKAIDYGLPQLIQPDSITPGQLATLLAFDNRAAAHRIANLDRAARDALLALPADTLKELARRLSQSELEALAAYQEQLAPPAASRLLREVASDPRLMDRLSKPALVNAVTGSRDQLSAITMLLRDNSMLSLTNIAGDWSLIQQGEVNYRVFLERYWLGLIAAFFLTLLALLALRRILFGRTPTVIIKTADGGGKK